MSAEDKAKQLFVDSSGRRKWDLDQFEQQAKEREAGLVEEKPKRAIVPPNQRGYVRARDHDIDLTQKLGKTVVISANTPLSQQGGYYCEVCDCLVKDSANYLDHINGKKHQRAMGLSMRTERATVDEVRERLATGMKRDISHTSPESFNDHLNSVKEREEREKREKKEKRKEYKRIKREEEEKQKNEGNSDEMLAMMGLPTGFGGGKK